MSAALLTLLMASPLLGPDTVVVCPDEFHDALKPWLEHRAKQGHTVRMVSAADPPESIRRQIRRLASRERLRHVVLVGDAWPSFERGSSRARCVPVHWAKAEVNVRWGSEPHIATDNWYADLDDDDVPDLAIGRITADTPEELSAIVDKILAYELSNDFGPWRRRLNFVAGIGSFGMLTDKMLESAVKCILVRDIPAGFDVSMTYGNWQSPFCPDPRAFHLATLEQLNEGCQFWVYLGHGHVLELDRVRTPDGDHHIFDNGDAAKIESRNGAPIAVFLACYTGAFDARIDCLAEEMLRAPGGPVAIFAGSRVTMPYAMAVLGTELIDEFFRGEHETIGEAILTAKHKLMQPYDPADQNRAMLDALAVMTSPGKANLAAERAEHLLLYNLIGDPLLRLRRPQSIQLEVADKATAGDLLDVAGNSPVEGRACVELVVQRDSLTFASPPRNEYPQTDEAFSAFQDTYLRANDSRLAKIDLTVPQGRFQTRLPVPKDASGSCHVRVFIEGSDDFALAAAQVTIQKRTTAETCRAVEQSTSQGDPRAVR